MTEVTQILHAIAEGDPSAASQLLPLVYDELRTLAAQKLAHEKPGQTLSATALVHEAYLRLVGPGEESQWNSRGHFFAAAAEAMRRVLVENARRKGRRLERLSGVFLGQFLGGESAQLVIDQRQQLAGRLRVALLDGGQDARHFTHGRHPQARVSRRNLLGQLLARVPESVPCGWV